MVQRIKSALLQNLILIENFSYLSLLQGSNLIIFLIIVPILFRTLGQEYYGLVVFGQTISIYFSILVNFGFTITGTRDVSINRNDPDKLSVTVSTIIILKQALFVASILVLTILVIFIPLLRAHDVLFYLSMLFCLSEALFPIWYFRGIEKMKYITFINIATRVLSAIMIFCFVRKPEDYYLVPLFLGIGTVSGAIIGLRIMFYHHHIKFRIPSIKNLFAYFNENVPLFISNVSSQIYVNANKLIVGSFLGMQEVAIYDVADKIVNIVKVPVNLVGQTLFPRVSKDKNISFIKKPMAFVFLFFLIVYLTLFIFAGPIVVFISGSFNPVAVNLLRLLAISVLPVCLSLFFADLTLIPLGYVKEYTKMRMAALVVYLICIGLLLASEKLGTFQLAGVIIIVETFVLFASIFLCQKNGLLKSYYKGIKISD